MEKDREPRNKPAHLWPINLQQRRKDYTIEKRQSLQQVVLGKLDNYMKINQIRTLPHTIHKNKLEGFPRGAVVKNPPANAGDTGSSSSLGRSHVPQSK